MPPSTTSPTAGGSTIQEIASSISSNKSSITVVNFGDSFTQGDGYYRTALYGTELAGCSITQVLGGANGYTIADVRSVYIEQQNLMSRQPEIATLLIGGNDFNWEIWVNGRNARNVYDDVVSAIVSTKTTSPNTTWVVSTATHLQDNQYARASVAEMNAAVDEYNNYLKTSLNADLASSGIKGVAVDVYQQGWTDADLSDGIHPIWNTGANNKHAKAFATALKPFSQSLGACN